MRRADFGPPFLQARPAARLNPENDRKQKMGYGADFSGEGLVFPYPRGARIRFQGASLTLSAAFAALSIRLYAGEASRNILPAG